ncbi:MAG TPA: DUF3568 family protein [Gemmataceae bacterium]|nr:DUF3568 family protein [Gemmataceae bacterium]
MQGEWRTWRRRAACLAAAAVLLPGSGCLLVAAGAGAAAGGVGYAYYKGKVCRSYPASYTDVWAAAQTALTELGLPLESLEQEAGGGTITSRTADGSRLRVYVEAEPSRIPVEGVSTRVCVRVATFGDEALSQRLLDQIGYHLVPVPGTVPATPVPPAARWAPPATPVPPQTAPPPLLPPEPIPAETQTSSRCG